MLREASDNAILILEGPSDEKALRRFSDYAACFVVLSDGKDNALSSIVESNDRQWTGILCIIDRDYDDFLGRRHDIENLVVLEQHDLEMLLILSPAGQAVIAELGSQDKIALLAAKGTSVIDLVARPACLLGRLRLFALENGLNLAFEGMRFRYVSRDFEIDLHTMVQDVFNRSGQARYEYRHVIEYILRWDREEHSQYMMCNGHDFAILLGKALQHKAGSQNSTVTDGQSIERYLRLAFGWAEFGQCGLFGEIRAWEERNEPYRCLARSTA